MFYEKREKESLANQFSFLDCSLLTMSYNVLLNCRAIAASN